MGDEVELAAATAEDKEVSLLLNDDLQQLKVQRLKKEAKAAE